MDDKFRVSNKIEMTRKIVKITFAAARKSELVDAWRRLGFTVDAAADAIPLADGVSLAFFAADDPEALGLGQKTSLAFLSHFAARRGGAAMLSFSGAPDAHLGPQPKFLGAAECFFELAAQGQGEAPPQPNGVVGVKILAAVADDPADHAEFLQKITGQREMLATSAGLEMRLDGARLDVLTPNAFAFKFAAKAPDFSVFRIAGIVFAVKDLGESEKILRENGVATKLDAGRLHAGPREGACVSVAFETV